MVGMTNKEIEMMEKIVGMMEIKNPPDTSVITMLDVYPMGWNRPTIDGQVPVPAGRGARREL